MDSLTALEARFPGGRETDPGHPRNPANAWTRGALNRFANPRYHVFQKAGKIEVGPVVPDAQQLREAFPWDESPRYLIRDRDHTFDGLGATAKAMGMHEVLTAPRSPCKTHCGTVCWIGPSRPPRSRSSCSMKQDWNGSSNCIATTTNDPAHIRRLTKTRRFLVQSQRRSVNPSWRSRKSAACIIDTNGTRRDPDAVELVRRQPSNRAAC